MRPKITGFIATCPHCCRDIGFIVPGDTTQDLNATLSKWLSSGMIVAPQFKVHFIKDIRECICQMD